MSINPIELLKEKVSSTILNNLYTIFHLVFTKQVDLYDLPVYILYRHFAA
ncbi:hypothetical protein J562_4149 [Acinetobacter baumannii 1440750]|nr:hypothetical protein J562_4149 [Acinetobacter baumannii 1440750]